VDLPQTLYPARGPKTGSSTGIPDEVSGGTFLDDPLARLSRSAVGVRVAIDRDRYGANTIHATTIAPSENTASSV
jgi:hypothetical protein